MPPPPDQRGAKPPPPRRRSPLLAAALAAALLAVAVGAAQRGGVTAGDVAAAARARLAPLAARLARAAPPPAAAECACGADGGGAEPAACRLDGLVPDCCCSYAAVERLNRDAILPLVSELVRAPFFRYFKVDLWCECPLWPDDAVCSLRDCAVCECEAGEVPAPWREGEARAAASKAAAAAGGGGAAAAGAAGVESCDAAARESSVDRSVPPHVRARLVAVPDWRGFRNPWMPDDDAPGGKPPDYQYINLLKNPERYTGYKGEHAHRVWGAIYGQRALARAHAPGAPPEARVFYRLLSGVHASISAHICGEYLVDEEAGVWGPNPECFRARLGNPGVRDRVENLYFTHLFVLRAVLKAAPGLAGAGLHTGDAAGDARAVELLGALARSRAVAAACPVPFDEGRLWKGDPGRAAELRGELQAAFRNITRAMDCVGCEKCKMWGKLQLLGVATALKVLFAEQGCAGEAPLPGGGAAGLQLERNEAIALVNLLERLAVSVEIVRSMSLAQAAGGGGGELGSISGIVGEPLAPSL